MDTSDTHEMSDTDLIARLRNNRAFAISYVRAAMEDLDADQERMGGLVALRQVCEAHGGLGALAKACGVSRTAVYRALSESGNPTLKTLIAVLRTVGLRLSIEDEPNAHPDIRPARRGRPKRIREEALKQDTPRTDADETARMTERGE